MSEVEFKSPFRWWALIDVCIGRDEDEANLLYDNFMSCKEAFRGMSLNA